MNKKLFSALFAAAALVLMVISPSQYGFSVAGVNITPADILLPAAFAAAFFAGDIRFRSYSFSCAVFLFFALLSCVFSDTPTASLKEWAQYFLYFAVAERIADAALTRSGGKWIERAAWLFTATGACVVAVGLVQYFSDDPDVFPLMMRQGLAVRGTFGNGNVLCGYLSLLLPFVFGLLVFRRREKITWKTASADAALALLLAAGLLICLSGAALFAVCAVVIAMAALRGRWHAVATASLLFAAFFYIAPELPRDNFTTAVRSVEIYNSDSGEIRYAEYATLPFEAGEPTRRYPQWQAASMMILEKPLTGFGPGMYKKNVGQFYDTVPRATGPSEPDIQNLYLVIGSTCGIPALLAFISILLGPLFARKVCPGASAEGLGRDCAPRTDYIALSASFALLSFAVTAIWHPLLVRGLGLPLVFMMVLARKR